MRRITLQRLTGARILAIVKRLHLYCYGLGNQLIISGVRAEVPGGVCGHADSPHPMVGHYNP